MTRKLSAALATLSLMGLPTAPAAADDLFSITAVGNGVNTVTATDSSVLDLSEAAIETFDDFASLSGQNVVATLTYAGVANTARYTINAAGTSATLEFPLTGFSRTFTGSNADDLADQIEEFIQDDGADVYAEVLEQINQQSIVAVFDGNPFATTALQARHTFDLYGVGSPGPAWANHGPVFFNPETQDEDYYINEYDAYGSGGPVGWYAINPRYSVIDADPFDGYAGGVDLAGGLFFNETVGIAAGVTLQYVDYEDTGVFHSVGHFAVPINLIPRTRVHPVSWQITPFVTSGIGGSIDAAAGGAFLGAGGATNLRINLGDAAALTLGGQIVYYDGQDLDYDDYEFKTELDQSLATAGALLTTYLDGPDGNLYLTAGANYFTYLEEAAVDEWISPEIGLGFRFNDTFRMSGAYRPIFGTNDYEAHTLQLNLVFSF
jgi:hypothetical protein